MNSRTLVPLSEFQSATVEWLWTDRIPLGGITILEGDPGDGKSSIMYDLSARVTTGDALPCTGDIIAPAGVVLLQAEDLNDATVRPSIDSAGGDPARISVYDKRRFSDAPLSLPDDIHIIKQAIEEVNAKLVVIDPLTAFLRNPNSESTVRVALGKLSELAEEKNVAVVLVRHLTKGKSSNVKYRGSGSIAIIAAARSSLSVDHDPSSKDPYQHRLALTKSNLSDAPPLIYRTLKQDDVITVEWLGESTCSGSVDNETSDRFNTSQLDEACFVLYTILAEHGEPMPAKDVQAKAQTALVSVRTLKRAKDKLGVASRRRTVTSEVDGKPVAQWVWLLPETDDTYRSYRERALKEQIEITAENDPGYLGPEIADNSVELADEHLGKRRWDDDEAENQCAPRPAIDVTTSRPWDES